MYDIVYLWHGERHRAGQYADLKQALAVLELWLKDGWRAWVEQVGG